MSTVLLFAPPQPYEEVERQRDEFQLRAAEYRLALDEVQKWLNAYPEFEMGGGCISVVGWDDMKKLVEGVLATRRNDG